MLRIHKHNVDCGCPSHRSPKSSPLRPGLWGSVLTAAACAVCPVCLSTYAKFLSTLGVGFGLSEAHHLILLVISISSSILISLWRSIRARRYWPLGVALVGAGLVLAGHLLGEVHALEWMGILILLGGGLGEQFRLRRSRARLAEEQAALMRPSY